MTESALRAGLACAAAFASQLLSVPGALAQSPTGSISGTVLDSTGAALPGAGVTATNTGTAVARNTISGRTGLFTFP